MNPKYTAIIVIVVVFLIYSNIEAIEGLFVEGFETKAEKAQAIHDWFKANPKPKYEAYRDDLKSASNIVEYEDMRGLISRRPNFTLEDTAAII